MADESSFDIASKPNMQELANAVAMAMREIQNRFDFKGSISNIELDKDTIKFTSEEEFKLKNVIDILQNKMVKRGISLKFLEYGAIDSSLGGHIKQDAKIKTGIPQEKAKEINKMIKNTGLKVRSQIQGEEIRVFAKKRDDLQAVIGMLKKATLPIELQFVNYR